MGLDTVELVIRVEETFGIAIPDAEAETIVTMGDLRRYVVARLGLEESSRARSRCPSQLAFHRLRRALVEGLGVDRGLVRLATPMGALVASEGRREVWDRLAKALDVPLPRLVWPARVSNAFVIAFVFGVPAVAWLGIVAGVSPADGFAAGVILLIVLGLLAAALAAPLATEVPPACATVRGAVGLVLFRALESIRDEVDSGTIWDVLRQIVAEQAGVDAAGLTEATSFVGDLGLD